jgi:broad specificity phosphatase PhoE
MFHKLNKMQNRARVLIVRHGSTDLNKEGGTSADRIRGHVDVPLNNKGRADAEVAAKKLKGEQPYCIYSSDLDRAEETADIINQYFHAPVEVSFDLRPWNLGSYEGAKTEDVIDELNEMAKHDNVVPEGGECFKDFRERYLKKLKEIIDEAKLNRKTIFVVSHFRNVKCAMAWISAGQPADFTIDLDYFFEDNIKPGDVFEVPMQKEAGETLEKE